MSPLHANQTAAATASSLAEPAPDFEFTSDISSEDWAMPAGFKAGSDQFASLYEVVDPKIDTDTLYLGTPKPAFGTDAIRTEPTEEQVKNLIVTRLEQQGDYSMYVVGEGEINKQRAIAEISNETRLGQYLLDFEKEHLDNLVKAARTIYEQQE